jgi:hypothetical protein
MKRTIITISVTLLATVALAISAPCASDEYLDSEFEDRPQVQPAGDRIAYIARGTVSSEGDVFSDRNVESVTWNSSNSWWVVTLTGVSYYYLYYNTLTNPLGASGDLTIVTDSLMGDLIVAVYDSGQRVKKGFSFAVAQ